MEDNDGKLSSVGLEAAVEPGESAMTDLQPLKLDGLFILIGREPNNERFKNLVKLDEEGFIASDETCKTSCEGVFCAGDTRKKPLNQLVTSTADGAVAAPQALRELLVISVVDLRCLLDQDVREHTGSAGYKDLMDLICHRI